MCGSSILPPVMTSRSSVKSSSFTLASAGGTPALFGSGWPARDVGPMFSSTVLATRRTWGRWESVFKSGAL